MKNLFKISVLALCVGIFASGCSGCGEKLSGSKNPDDTIHKVKDTTKAAIDTAKKDTSKKK